MRLLLHLLIFTLSTSALFGADIYLYSQDGKPMPGFEFTDFDVQWVHAKYLADNAVGRGYPVAHFKHPERPTGWVYNFSQSPREIRAAYRKANRVVKRGKYTVVLHTATWCGPCQAYKKSGELDRIKQVADLEVIDIDDTNPLQVRSVPTLVVFDADNHEVARYTRPMKLEQIQELTP